MMKCRIEAFKIYKNIGKIMNNHNINLIQKQQHKIFIYNKTDYTLQKRKCNIIKNKTQSINSTNDYNLYLYNSITREKQLFIPIQSDKVLMYVCGVTVYDYSHIGHARVYVTFDVLNRLLRYLGYDVYYVRNYTDVDDKIIKRANETNQDIKLLTEKFINEFKNDMELLGCLEPSLEPKVTEYITQIINMIEIIIKNGHGYIIDGDVYFDTMSIEGYGRLSRRSKEDNRAGERVAIDKRKKNLSDFALWKSAKPGEPSWDSPWGHGRPGWHIECSCMIKEAMGPVIDIHGGGCDLIFPHHENELAQSQAAADICDKDVMLNNGIDFVKYWIHNGVVNVNEEKMSKSTGNFFTIREILDNYHPLSLRWMLLSTQYRRPLNYTKQLLEESENNIYYLYETLKDLNELELSKKEEEGEEDEIVIKSLCDDLNTAVLIAELFKLLKKINDIMHTKKGKKMKDRKEMLSKYYNSIRKIMEIIGLKTGDINVILEELKYLALKRSGMKENDILDIIKKRNTARQEKNYELADALRSELCLKGIALCDSPEGTTWRPGGN